MRGSLRHWFRITEEEERELWQTALLSFDASALLNIYAYSSNTRDELMKLLEANRERVRLPHQFGLEYSRNRAIVIVKQVNNYSQADKDLESFEKKHLHPKKEHPHLSAESVNAISAVRSELSARRKEIEMLIASDPYASRILDIFTEKLSSRPTEQDLKLLHDTAAARYAKSVPPGYSDLKEKGAPDAYADYIGWYQLIEIAKREQKGFIFVTDDLKDDWWLIIKDRTIGPRPELIEEFFREANQPLWLYTSESFLRAAKAFTGAEIRDDSIEELTQRLASQLKSSRRSEQKPPFDEVRPIVSADKPFESAKSEGNEVSADTNFTDSAKLTAYDEEQY